MHMEYYWGNTLNDNWKIGKHNMGCYWLVVQSALLSVAGTKWCGNSDIAKTYFDLGREKDVDKCCRTHDLCPVKVRSYRTRYNLTNENFYTK
jgi:hypothetical protein